MFFKSFIATKNFFGPCFCYPHVLASFAEPEEVALRVEAPSVEFLVFVGVSVLVCPVGFRQLGDR